VGLLTRSNARQTDHQHWECLSKLGILGVIPTRPNLSLDMERTNRTQQLSMAENEGFRNPALDLKGSCCPRGSPCCDAAQRYPWFFLLWRWITNAK
jgi:hypothetical protein